MVDITNDRERLEKLSDELADARKQIEKQIANSKCDCARATLPPTVGTSATRPQAASKRQRQKRREARVESKLTHIMDGPRAELLLYGTIGEDWFGDGITADAFNETLETIGNVQDITLRINSGGGDVFDATAIYSMLLKHPANVIVEIEGVAASAATLIAMAADEIRMTENAHFMIHRASGGVFGNASDVSSYLKLLENADKLLRLTYTSRTGLSDSELSDMMQTDNWMTAEDALEHGFIDAIDEAKTVTADSDPENFEPKRLAALSADRLTRAATSLAAFSLDLVPPTGSSPAPVSPEVKEITMNKKLRAKCEAAGMDAKFTDEQAQEWLSNNLDKINAPAANVTAPVDGLSAEAIVELWDKREAAKAEAQKAFAADIDGMISLAFGDHVPAGLRAECVALGDKESAKTAIMEAKANASNAYNPTIVVSPTQPRDNHVAALRTAVLSRCLSNISGSADVKLSQQEILDKHLPEAERGKGWEDFRHMPLSAVAQECLLADGYTDREVRKMTKDQVAQAAFGFRRQANVRAEGLHTTGSLSLITQDAVNKSLRAGYEMAPQTWRGPGRQAASVSDFKTIHRISLGAAPNLPVWPDNTSPEQVKLSNEEETYAVEARASTLSFSWRIGVNDDIDALSRRPQIMGDAAGRTVNAVFWTQVTSNPTMSDGQVLFLETPAGNRQRQNLDTGSATPTNTTIGEMKSRMRLMRGINNPEGNEGDDVLNLMPTYIVGPAALEETILKQVFSGSDPAGSGNSAIFNTSSNLVPVIEPLLDADSATAWYLWASPSRVDTVEVTFLAGQESPITHEWMDDGSMAMNYSIIQTFAAKAVDHRGIQKHDGV